MADVVKKTFYGYKGKDYEFLHHVKYAVEGEIMELLEIEQPFALNHEQKTQLLKAIVSNRRLLVRLLFTTYKVNGKELFILGDKGE